MTISGVIAGIVTRLNTISGLRVYPQVPGASTLETPCVWAFRSGQIEADTFDGVPDDEYAIVVCVAGNSYEQGQTDLYAYLDAAGSSSIRAAIEADRSLDGAAHGVFVLPERNLDFANGIFSAEVPLHVY